MFKWTDNVQRNVGHCQFIVQSWLVYQTLVQSDDHLDLKYNLHSIITWCHQQNRSKKKK